MNDLAHLNWRYAVKRYDTNKTLTTEEVDCILESIRLTPTSLGIQAFKVLVLGPESPHREALRPLLNNQPQSVEASHIFIFAAQKSISEKDIEEHIQRIATERQQPLEELSKFQLGIKGFIGGLAGNDLTEWVNKQTYIALGVAMSEAARMKIDTTPMEGFKAKELDSYFKLPEQNLASTVILAAGKRDHNNDFLANLKKVRKSAEELFEEK